MNDLMLEQFKEIVYDLLSEDDSNFRANMIIDAADEYAESAKAMPTAQISCENWAEIEGYSQDTISRQDALDALMKERQHLLANNQPGAEHILTHYGYNVIDELPTIQPDEKLEKCRFEYINACRIVNCPTPDTTRKERRDAYAVIKALQPIFGDVTF